MNSYKHGLTAKTIVIGGEDPDQFDALRADFWREFKPQVGLESELVNRLAELIWRLRRVPAFEAALIMARSAEIEPTKTQKEQILEAERLRRDDLEMRARRYLPKKIGDENDSTKGGTDSTTDTISGENGTKSATNPQPPAEPQNDPARCIGPALIKDAQNNDVLGKLSRYEAGLVNGITKTLHLLSFLQDGRRET
jgi:hypothetical protein